MPLDTLGDEFEKTLRDVASVVEVPAIRAAWEQALDAPAWSGPPVWLHGDLHPANVVTTQGTLTGVLDFGDIASGDPATDLAAAWLLLPGRGIEPFFETYANADDATVRRARGWVLFRGLSLVAIGQAGDRGLPGGKPSWRPAGHAALRRVLAQMY